MCGEAVYIGVRVVLGTLRGGDQNSIRPIPEEAHGAVQFPPGAVPRLEDTRIPTSRSQAWVDLSSVFLASEVACGRAGYIMLNESWSCGILRTAKGEAANVANCARPKTRIVYESLPCIDFGVRGG